MNTQNIYTDDLLQGTDDNIQDRLHEILGDKKSIQIFRDKQNAAKTITGSMKFHVRKIGRSPKTTCSEK